MFKLFSATNSSSKYFLNLINKKGIKTQVRPIQEKIKEIKTKDLVKSTEQILEENRKFANRLKLLIYLIPFATGVYFIYRGLWFDYLTVNKRQSLNLTTYAGLGFGAMMTGALAGNFLFTLNTRRSYLFNNSIIKPGLRLNFLAIVFMCFAVTGELMDRNLFFWGSGILASFGLLGNFYLYLEGARTGILTTSLISSYQLPCFVFVMLSIVIFFTTYRERSKEMTLVTEYKQRQKFVNHLTFK